MPDDKGILRVIGTILQKYEAGKAKKKREDRLQRGLESKLRDPQSSLSKREKVLLKSQLLADRLDERTDEGALMGLRSKFPNF